MDGPSDNMEGVVGEPEDGRWRLGSNDPFPHAGIDGRGSVTEVRKRDRLEQASSLCCLSRNHLAPYHQKCVALLEYPRRRQLVPQQDSDRPAANEGLSGSPVTTRYRVIC
jgi:hypothetical protein